MIDLEQHEDLLVCQQVEHLEAFIGFETANQYSVLTPDGYEMLHAFEESGPVGRQFMGSKSRGRWAASSWGRTAP